jgi:hypothetical protein
VLIVLVLWCGLVLAIMVIANVGHDNGSNNLTFDVGRANQDKPPGD